MTQKAADSMPVIRDVYPEWLLGHELETVSAEEIKRRFEAEQKERVGS